MDAGERVQRPRQPGVDEQRGQGPGADGVGGQRGGDVHGQGRGGRRARRDGAGEAPEPERADEQRPDDEQRAGQAVGPEREQSQDGRQAHARGEGPGAAEPLRPPAAQVLTHQHDRSGRPGQQLAGLGDAVQDQLPAADEQHDQHERPDDDIRPRVVTAELLAEVSAELGQAVTTTLAFGRPLAAEVAQPGRAPHALEAGHLGVRHLAGALEPATAGDERREPDDLPDPGAEHGPHLARPPAQEPDDRAAERVQHMEHGEADEVEARGCRQRGAQPVAFRQRERVEVRAALRQVLAVPHAGVGDHQHACARQVRPPAQVEVIAVEVDVLGEAAQLAEQVDPHEEARRGHAEHIAHRVVLLLVQLPDLGRLQGDADAVGAEADVLEHARAVPVDQLGPDDASVRPVGLGHQLADRGRVEGDVVVQEAEEPGALDEPHRLVGGRAESGVVLQRPHERIGEPLADLGHHGRLRAGDQEEQPQVRVVLAGQRVEHLVEPRSGLVHDHDRDDRRGVDGGIHHAEQGRRGLFGARVVHRHGSRRLLARCRLAWAPRWPGKAAEPGVLAIVSTTRYTVCTRPSRSERPARDPRKEDPRCPPPTGTTSPQR